MIHTSCLSKLLKQNNQQTLFSLQDRILYKSKQDSITPHIYSYCPNLNFSDHRPVYGTFCVILKPCPLS